MIIDEKVRKRFIENLTEFKMFIYPQLLTTDSNLFPVGYLQCYFCLLAIKNYNYSGTSCKDTCYYGKKYGSCKEVKSKFRTLVKMKNEFQDGLIPKEIGDKISEDLKKVTDNCIEKIKRADDVNEIMVAKKLLFIQIAYTLAASYGPAIPNKSREFISFIDKNYWVDESMPKLDIEKIEKIEEIKVFDLKDDVKNKLLELGYNENDRLAKVSKQTVKVGQKVKILRPGLSDFVGYLINVTGDTVLIIRDNHKMRWNTEPIKVGILCNNKISIKDFEKAINKKYAEYKYEFI